ncbi:hypothetical protein [Pedobacter aquatilis]|uniref:hypothetical protein n=1 Tax=Pedobacter aquatilis TaxID=351343 RepID=UPI00292FB1F7|nr:hypothetical protein [Pedobacter aquatilis]
MSVIQNKPWQKLKNLRLSAFYSSTQSRISSAPSTRFASFLRKGLILAVCLKYTWYK